MPHGPVTRALLAAIADAMVEWGQIGAYRVAAVVLHARGTAWVRRQIGAAECVPERAVVESLLGYCCAA